MGSKGQILLDYVSYFLLGKFIKIYLFSIFNPFSTFYRILDFLKSFFLIWPSNVMPIWLFITVLQLKIPLNLLLRTCCIEELSNFKITWISAAVITFGFFINVLTLTGKQEDQVSFCDQVFPNDFSFFSTETTKLCTPFI